jgi:prepilin peptidase CpaA
LLGISFPPPAVTALLIALVAIAAVYDVLVRRLPNWLTAAGLIIGLTLNTILRGVWPGLSFSLAGLLAAFAVYFTMYSLRAMGAGDVKLMAAVGSMVGWEDWIAIFLITAVIGGVTALVLVAVRGRVRKTLWNVAFILSEMKSGRPAYARNEELDVRSSKALSLPHGAVIAVGTAVFLALARRR